MGPFAKTTLTIRHTASVWRIKRYAYLLRRGNGDGVSSSQQLTFALAAAGPNNDTGGGVFVFFFIRAPAV